MNQVEMTGAAVVPPQWAEYGLEARHGSFGLAREAGLGSLAARHYDRAPTLEPPVRRLASYVSLEGGLCHLDLLPADEGEWTVRAQRLGKRPLPLDRTMAAARRLLTETDPGLDPVSKGLEVRPETIILNPDQQVLLEDFDSRVLYEDPGVLAVNKPPNISAHWRGGHLGVNEIAQKWRGPELAVPHRLDNLTSGVQLLAKTRSARRRLGRQFSRADDDRPGKAYIALVEGSLEYDQSIGCFLEEDEHRVMRANRHGRTGKFAKTTVSRLAEVRSPDGGTRSVLGVQIHTGRTHQIRASLAAIGLPIVGDPIYNTDPARGRMRLHASFLRFTSPHTDRSVEVRAPLPDDFIPEADALEKARGAAAAAEFAAA